jgi:hypothetical protein
MTDAFGKLTTQVRNVVLTVTRLQYCTCAKVAAGGLVHILISDP